MSDPSTDELMRSDMKTLIANGWRSLFLTNIADLRMSNVDKNSVSGETPVRLCNYVDVYKNDYITSAIDFMEATATPSEIARFGIEVGDVMITKDSETPDDIGVSSVAVWSESRLVCGYHLALFKPDRNQVDPIFLAKQLSLPTVAAYYGRLASGSTRYGLSNAGIANTPLLLPPLPQQRKIARILTTLDNVITHTEALIAKYQAIKQGLMHDLFTRGVDTTGKLRPPQSEAPELYKQSELGWIPKEWEAVRLIEIAEVKGGKRLPAGQPFANAPTAFPYIRVSDMRDWTIDDSAIEYVPDHIEPFIRQYKISCDDLYISIAEVYLGLVGMVPTSLDNAQLTENAAKIVLRNKEAHSKEFLTAFFHSTLFFCQLEQVKGIGSGVPKLALHRIEAFMVPIPKRDEQNRIAESLLQIRAVITKECEAVSKAKDEKTGLMQDLLTGKVPVKADEPEEITP